MRTQRTIAYVFAACLVSLLAGSALAEFELGDSTPTLIGKYRISMHTTCAVSDAGFDGLQVLSPGNMRSVFWEGITTYFGNGTATQTDHGIGYDLVPYDANTTPMFQFDETCDWTYTINSNKRSFIQVGSCSDPFVKLKNIKWVGQIGARGQVLSLAIAEPVVRELVTTGDVHIHWQICSGEGTAIRIPG